MKNLLKSDFYRARKDKLLLIGLLVSVGLVLMQVLLIKGLVSASSAADADTEVIGNALGTSGLALWFNGISIMGNTTQYIIPIFLTIFFVKEFSDRTIRNKLIVGYSRTQIFFSIIIVHAVLSVITTLMAGAVISWISQNEGRNNPLKNFINSKSYKEKRVSVWSLTLIIGILAAIAMIVLVEMSA